MSGNLTENTTHLSPREECPVFNFLSHSLAAAASRSPKRAPNHNSKIPSGVYAPLPPVRYDQWLLYRVDYTATNEDEKNKFLMTLINLSLRQSRGVYQRDRVVGSGNDRGSRLSANATGKIAASNLPPEVQIVEEDYEKGVGGDNSAWPIKSQGWSE